MSISNGQYVDFDTLKPQEYRFKYNRQMYVAREASHSLAREWRSLMLSTFKQSSFGDLQPGEGLPKTELMLVAGCLFKVNEATGAEELEREEVIKDFPNRIFKPVYERIREMSLLNERDLTTPEAIEKEIKRLQEMLEKMKAQEDKGGTAKNLLNAGMEKST